MDDATPERIGTPNTKFEDSPLFNYINSLSPIDTAKSVHVTQTFNSLSYAPHPSVFTSPHVASYKDSNYLRRHHYWDSSKPDAFFNESNNLSKSEEIVDATKLTDTQLNHVPHHEEVSENMFEVEGSLPEKCWTEQENGGTKCDWESLISEANNSLIFYPPNKTMAFEGLNQKSQNQREIIYSRNMSQFQADGNASYREQHDNPIYPCQQYVTEDPSTQPKDLNEMKDNDPSENMAKEPFSNLQRSIRRRCLVFEMDGARKKNLNYNSSCSSSTLSEIHDDKASNSKQLVPLKHDGDSSRHILPGIGLHLNAFASTPKTLTVLKRESLATGEMSSVNGIQVASDDSQESIDIIGEHFNQSGPKKTRRRFEHEACKRCNCKKSKCLKLYCECFAAGVYCIEPCSCQECFNNPIHEDTVLATRKQIETRNPLAFTPKVIKNSDSTPETGDESNQTPASARHKRGCNCKKSNCLKKYCECFQGGVGCSINCRCEGCKNAFGIKAGFALLEVEATSEDEETGKSSNVNVEKPLQNNHIQNNEDQTTYYSLPATPLRKSRLSMQLPFSSNSKLHQSFTYKSLSEIQTSHKLSRPSFQKNHQTNTEENDMPEILQGNNTPKGGIRIVSPNSKRVSPPHCDYGSSHARRINRKLILQYIPSFPSLTQP